uniref:Uncharacterized protein n=1 Tax=Sinocyclocheilus rhinocerous TaxID=307959 RepID=A0A673HH55_9TELE
MSSPHGMQSAACFSVLARRALPFYEYAGEFCKLAAVTAMDDATLNHLFWLGANSHCPLDLPDTSGLCWREGVFRGLGSVRSQARTSPPPSAVHPRQPADPLFRPGGAPDPQFHPGRAPDPQFSPGRASGPPPSPGRASDPPPSPGRAPDPQFSPGRAPDPPPSLGRAPDPQLSPGRAPDPEYSPFVVGAIYYYYYYHYYYYYLSSS